MIAMVAAVAENGVIGSNNALPWHLPTDLQHFRDITKNKTVVMGSKTFQSIVNGRGSPLPNRTNVVITRNPDLEYEGVKVVHDPQDIVAIPGDLYIIGGGQIYSMMMDVADTLYLTEVHANVDGDAFFPKVDTAVWRETSRESHEADAENDHAFDFVTYERRSRA
ncbi:dihydrofolate reductase [Candidatus Saccharibacteria bacterium]|nr:dihydrofolate reductase [Candidatus Saccharibacteria bacterium]